MQIFYGVTFTIQWKSLQARSHKCLSLELVQQLCALWSSFGDHAPFIRKHAKAQTDFHHFSWQHQRNSKKLHVKMNIYLTFPCLVLLFQLNWANTLIPLFIHPLRLRSGLCQVQYNILTFFNEVMIPAEHVCLTEKTLVTS